MNRAEAPLGYSLLRKVGEGGASVVYEACDIGGRSVALKLMRAGAGQEFAVQFAMERTALTAIRHPSVVELLDHGEDGTCYLVLEYVDGRSIADVLRVTGALAIPAALRLGKVAAAALRSVHRAGFIHRDVKPSNLLVSDEGQLKLIDFGICRRRTSGRFATPVPQKRVARGTPPYMAPEQLSGLHEDRATDVYALGVVLYRALTGRLPFTGRSIHSVARSVHAQPLVPPMVLRPSCPRELDALLTSMLSCDIAKRPSSMGDVAAELRTIEAQLEREAGAVRELIWTSRSTVPPPPTSLEEGRPTVVVGCDERH